MEKFNFLDIQITNFINSLIPHNRFFDYFFSFFSLRGNSIFIWILVIILVLVLEERKNPGIQKRDILFVSVFLLSFITTTISVNYVLKNVSHRPRPCRPNSQNITASVEHGLVKCPEDYSFPSGHASTAFAAATVIAVFNKNKKRRWIYFFIAILISLSRIYLNYHYFLDIAAGALVGWLISIVILRLIKIRVIIGAT